MARFSLLGSGPVTISGFGSRSLARPCGRYGACPLLRKACDKGCAWLGRGSHAFVLGFAPAQHLAMVWQSATLLLMAAPVFRRGVLYLVVVASSQRCWCLRRFWGVFGENGHRLCCMLRTPGVAQFSWWSACHSAPVRPFDARAPLLGALGAFSFKSSPSCSRGTPGVARAQPCHFVARLVLRWCSLSGRSWRLSVGKALRVGMLDSSASWGGSANRAQGGTTEARFEGLAIGMVWVSGTWRVGRSHSLAGVDGGLTSHRFIAEVTWGIPARGVLTKTLGARCP